jgi:hypothetical protein
MTVSRIIAENSATNNLAYEQSSSWNTLKCRCQYSIDHTIYIIGSA